MIRLSWPRQSARHSSVLRPSGNFISGSLLLLLIIALSCVSCMRYDGSLNVNTKPPLVRPGDRVEVTIDTIESIKGLWRGNIELCELSLEEEKTRTWRIVLPETQDDDWGRTLRVRGGSLNKIPMKVWFKIPLDSALVGRDVILHVVMSVSYPIGAGGLTFFNDSRQIDKLCRFRVACSEEFEKYNVFLRNQSILVGVVVLLVFLVGMGYAVKTSNQ